jgi:hypothetical protein
VDALAPALVAIGLWLMYEAYKNPAPTPITTAKTKIAAKGSTT